MRVKKRWALDIDKQEREAIDLVIKNRC